MRKITLIAFLMALGVSSYAQTINNAGFENWTNGSPNGWDCSNQDLAFFSMKNIYYDSLAAQSGSKCLVAESKATAFFTMSGIVCNGNYIAPNPSNGNVETIKGMPETAKPNSVSVWYKYAPASSDSGMICIKFFKSGTMIASGMFVPKTSISTWTEKIININWIQNETPDTMLVLIKSSYGTTNSLGGAVAGTKLWIDNITFPGASAINDMSQDKLNIYPNPFAEYIKVESAILLPANYSIVDLMGRIVQSGNLTSETQTINTASLNSGLYTIVIKNNNASFTTRLVK